LKLLYLLSPLYYLTPHNVKYGLIIEKNELKYDIHLTECSALSRTPIFGTCFDLNISSDDDHHEGSKKACEGKWVLSQIFTFISN